MNCCVTVPYTALYCSNSILNILNDYLGIYVGGFFFAPVGAMFHVTLPQFTKHNEIFFYLSIWSLHLETLYLDGHLEGPQQQREIYPSGPRGCVSWAKPSGTPPSGWRCSSFSWIRVGLDADSTGHCETYTSHTTSPKSENKVHYPVTAAWHVHRDRVNLSHEEKKKSITERGKVIMCSADWSS